MSTEQAFVEYVQSQSGLGPQLSFKKMFGEYALYLHGRVVAFACDNQLYLNDPDGNGIELYRDRPREEWPMAPDGKGVAMITIPLDLEALLAEAT